MKFRAKLHGQSLRIDVGEVDTTSFTLGQLKEFISDAFHLDNGNVELSLNKTDVLGGDEVTLSDLGIVSGDLVHVIASDLPQEILGGNEHRRAQPIASFGSASLAVSLDRNHHSNKDENLGRNDQTSQTKITCAQFDTPTMQQDPTASGQSDKDVEADKMEFEDQTTQCRQRSLLEPLVIGESTASQVPALLSELYTGSIIKSPNDALFVVLHALMIESGFYPPGNADISTLPLDWKKSGYYMCIYDYVLTPDVVLECCLMAMPTGASMAVHGLSRKVGNFKTDHVQIKADNYVRDISQPKAPDAYRSLDRLSKLFKDNICLALLNHLATSAGFHETQGLLSLPCEVRMRLMCFLDARSVCILGQTCHQWKSIYKDNMVWRRLYIQKFGTLPDSSLSKDWYEMFKARYLKFVEEQERRRYLLSSLDDLEHPRFLGLPFGPFNPSHPFPPPHFLGGDHDLRPEFASGIPDLMNGRRGPASLREMPTAPDPFMNGGLSGRRGRGNRTPSPFFHHGPFM